MKKFYFTQKNIRNALLHLTFTMNTQDKPSVEITTLIGDIRLPGGGYIGCQKATVLIISHSISDFKLVIRRDDKKGELHEYPLDTMTIQWIKDNKIPIHTKI